MSRGNFLRCLRQRLVRATSSVAFEFFPLAEHGGRGDSSSLPEPFIKLTCSHSRGTINPLTSYPHQQQLGGILFSRPPKDSKMRGNGRNLAQKLRIFLHWQALDSLEGLSGSKAAFLKAKGSIIRCIQRAGCIVWAIYQRQSTKFPSAQNLSLLLSSPTRSS
jgi:hypothetical protein